MTPKPDFGRLRKVLLRQGEPDRVPFFDLYPSSDFIRTVTGKSGPEALVEFFYSVGYDYSYCEIGLRYEMHTLSTGTSHYVDNNHGAIENRSDFDRYRWPQIAPEMLKGIGDIERLLPQGMKMAIDFAGGGILECVMQLMGYIPFSYALYEDEQLVYDLFERSGRDHIQALTLCLERIGTENIGCIVMGDDMGFNTGTMISPDCLRRFYFPWLKKLVEIVHGHDLPFVLHSCGQLKEVMDDLIDDVKIDAKHSYEDKILPVTEAKRRYGSRLAILGGVDIDFLCRSSEEEVRSGVRRIITECAPGGGYALGTGNSIADYVPVGNYLAMLDEGWKAGVYPAHEISI